MPQNDMFGKVLNPYIKKRGDTCPHDEPRNGNDPTQSLARSPAVMYQRDTSFRKLVNPYKKKQPSQSSQLDGDILDNDGMDEGLLIAALERAEQKSGLTSAPIVSTHVLSDFDDYWLDDTALLDTLANAEASALSNMDRKRPAIVSTTAVSPPRKRPANPYVSKPPAKTVVVVSPAKETCAGVPSSFDEFSDSCLDADSLLQALRQAETSLNQTPVQPKLPIVSPSKTTRIRRPKARQKRAFSGNTVTQED